MAINPAKTLLVYNTNSSVAAASLANVDWYATARGCRSGADYHRMGFDLGTSDPNLATGWLTSVSKGGSADNILCATSLEGTGRLNHYVGQALLTAIRNMIIDNGIEALVIDSLVKPGIRCFGAQPYAIPLECYMALAYALGPITPASRDPTSISGQIILDLVPRRVVTIPGMLTATDRVGPNAAIPCGRLGYPGAALADIQRMVTDALAAELVDHIADPHLIGGKNYAGLQITADSHLAVVQAGFPASIMAWSENGGGPEYAGAQLRALSAFEAGAPLEVFGLLYAEGSQTPSAYASPSGPIFTALTMRPGGWAFTWQSSANLLAKCCFLRGGCAALSMVDEPFTNGVPGTKQIAMSLMLGRSMMEAVFLSQDMKGFRVSAYGDPLYAPYRSTSVAVTRSAYTKFLRT